MNRIIGKLRIAIAIAIFIVAGSNCAMHASIDTECWYAPMQPPTTTTETKPVNETKPT